MLQRQKVSFCVSQNIIAATHHFYKRLYYMPAFFLALKIMQIIMY